MESNPPNSINICRTNTNDFQRKKACRCSRICKLFGSPSWTRTNDTAVNSRVLYRLSYGGI